jgi:hypothetical protein
MSQMTLHTLVGTALTDPRFCHDLLNGRRHTLLADFDLTDEEREAVMVIEAKSIQDFAAHLHEWLRAQENHISRFPRPPVGSASWQRNLASRRLPYSWAG